MKYYLLLIAAVVIGQLFFSVVSVWYYQRSNPQIDFFKALQVYFKKEIGTYIMIFCFTLLLMFVLSDWMDLHATRHDLLLKEDLNKFEQAQIKFRTYATCYGVFAQFVALYFYKGGKDAIDKFGKSKGIDINNN